MRLPSSKAAAQQRSINLAMSSRGIAALKAVDPKASERFLRSVIPMRGRMIHGLRGELQSQPYDRNGQVMILFYGTLSRSIADPIFRPRQFKSLLSAVYQFHRPCASERRSPGRGSVRAEYPSLFQAQDHVHRL